MTKISLQKCIKGFLVEEDGAVTVDWVVLTSSVVLLGVLVASGIRVALESSATSIGTAITDSVAAALT